MITLKYRFISSAPTGNPICVLCDIAEGEADRVIFDINTEKFAEAEISGKRIRIRGGVCEISFSELPDGKIDVFILTDGQRIPATPLIKLEDCLCRFPHNEEMFREVFNKCLELTARITSCEKRLADAEEKIQPKPLLKFN